MLFEPTPVERVVGVRRRLRQKDRVSVAGTLEVCVLQVACVDNISFSIPELVKFIDVFHSSGDVADLFVFGRDCHAVGVDGIGVIRWNTA